MSNDENDVTDKDIEVDDIQSPDERHREIFTSIFSENTWEGSSRSGPGSSEGVTRLLRARLVEACRELGIRSVLDAPCGDAGWMAMIAETFDSYIGVDVVEPLIAGNVLAHARSGMSFGVADISADPLPKMDMVFCRDCLVHLPLETGLSAVANLKASGATWLAATTFPGWTSNVQSGVGGWRPLDLTLAPYSFPPPAKLIAERAPNPDDAYNMKAMGIWRFDDIDLLKPAAD